MITKICDLVTQLPGIEEQIAAKSYLEFLIEKSEKECKIIHNITDYAPRGINVDDISMHIWDSGMCRLVGRIHNGQKEVRQFKGEAMIYDERGLEIGHYFIKIPGIASGEQYQFVKVIQKLNESVASVRLSFYYGNVSESNVMCCYDFEDSGNTFIIE